MSPAGRYRVVPRTPFQTIAGETIVMGSGARRVYLLNETATVVWQALREPCSADDLGRLLARTYDVEAASARSDARELLQGFLRQGLIEGVGP